MVTFPMLRRCGKRETADDDALALQTLERTLKADFDVHSAQTPESGLELHSKGVDAGEIVGRLQAAVHRHVPDVLDGTGKRPRAGADGWALARAGMVFQEDVHNAADVLLVCRGQEVNPSMRRLLMRSAESTGQHISVLVSNPETPHPSSR